MSFEIMYDADVIAVQERVPNKEPIFGLLPNIKPDCVPFGMFRDGATESWDEIAKWFCSRAFPKERADCAELLEGLGMTEYDKWSIIKRNRGTLFTDRFWLRVYPEDTYEEFSLWGMFGFPPQSPFHDPA